jgi:hypothetical protein
LLLFRHLKRNGLFSCQDATIGKGLTASPNAFETKSHFVSVKRSKAEPTLGKRVRNVVLVWLLFGVVVGAGSGPPDSGVLGLVSGMIAGMMVLPFLGAVLGLLGGHAKEALLGAACGCSPALWPGWRGRGRSFRRWSPAWLRGRWSARPSPRSSGSSAQAG